LRRLAAAGRERQRGEQDHHQALARGRASGGSLRRGCAVGGATSTEPARCAVSVSHARRHRGPRFPVVHRHRRISRRPRAPRPASPRSLSASLAGADCSVRPAARRPGSDRAVELRPRHRIAMPAGHLASHSRPCGSDGVDVARCAAVAGAHGCPRTRPRSAHRLQRPSRRAIRCPPPAAACRSRESPPPTPGSPARARTRGPARDAACGHARRSRRP
jgi:hypothetical protein